MISTGKWLGSVYQISETLTIGSIARQDDGSYTAYGCTSAMDDTLIGKGLTHSTAKRRVEEWVRARIARING